MKNKTIDLSDGIFNVTLHLELGACGDDGATDYYSSGTIESDLKTGEEPYDSQIDALETLILSHAIAGVDIESDEYIMGISTTLETIGKVWE